MLTSSVDPQLLRRTACCNPADDAWISDVNARALLLLLPVEFREKFPSESPGVVSRSVNKNEYLIIARMNAFFDIIFYSSLNSKISFSALYRGSFMSADVLLNLLNELGKRDKMRGLPSILSL